MVSAHTDFRVWVLELEGDEYYQLVKEVLRDNLQEPRYDGLSFEFDGLMRYWGTMYVPKSPELRRLVWKEVHFAPYSRHKGVTKLLVDDKPIYFWKGMKNDATRFVASCFEC